MSGYIGSKAVFLSTTAAVVDGNITVSGTVDGVDIAARDAVLTSTTTTAGAALPKSGGTMTGGLTVDSGNGDQLSLDNAGERFTQISFKHNGAQEAALWYDATDDYLVAHGSAGDGFKVQTGGSNDRLTITSSGNVGIGTSSPNAVTNYTGLTLNNATYGGFIDIENNGTHTFRLLSNTTATYIRTIQADPLVFDTNDTERMRLDSSGVKIGPNSQDIQLLPASSNSGINKVYLRGNATDEKSTITLNHYGVRAFDISAGVIGSGLFHIGNGASDPAFVIDGSSNVGIGTSASLTNLSVAGSESSFLSRVNIDVSDNANRTLTLSEQKITFAAPDTYGTNYNAFINYGLTSLQFAVGNTERMRIDLSGAVTMPAQPAFLAQVATVQSNLANYVNVVIFGTEVFDQNADFNPSNGIFTAPVTGKYMLSTFIGLDQIPATGTGVLQLQIAASNRTVYAAFDPIVFDATSTKYTFTQSLLVDMDASDTAKIQIYMPVASSTVDISTASWFSGYLVA